MDIRELIIIAIGVCGIVIIAVVLICKKKINKIMDQCKGIESHLDKILNCPPDLKPTTKKDILKIHSGASIHAEPPPEEKEEEKPPAEDNGQYQ